VPVIVIVRVPVVAELLAVNVTVLLVPVVGFGLNAAVVPLPKPDAVSVTLPVNPPVRLMVIVLVPFELRVIVTLVGEAEIVKLPDAVAFTVSETVVVCVMLPDTP